MGEPLHRQVSYTFRVGRDDVLITIHEYYDGENPLPTILKVTGPNGLVTRTYEEMMDLLGIPHPQKNTCNATPAATENGADEPGGESTPLALENAPGVVENATEANCTAVGAEELPGWDPRIGGDKRHRHVRVGDQDIVVLECEQPASQRYNVPARRWFEAPNGLRTLGYYEMLDKLGGRPKPLLPEDEFRLASESIEPGSTGTEFPETGSPRIIEDAFCVLDGSSASEMDLEHADATAEQELANAAEKPAGKEERRKEREPAKYLGAKPWTLDDRKTEEISDTELEMRLIWHAERIRESNPDLYEAALDSVKREEYLAREAEKRRLQEEEQLAEETAPRCQFIKTDGEPCGSFAVKGSRFCYFHSRTAEGRRKKKKKRDLSIPVLEDDLAVQMAVTHICRGLAEDSLEPRRASILLYGLQVAAVALRRKRARHAPEERA